MEKKYIECEALNVAIHESWQSNPHNNQIARQTHNHEHRHFLGLLHKQPTADVEEVRHGKWLEETEYYADDYSECNVRKVYACSLCGRTEKRKEPYCNCGAKMDGGK